MGMDPPGVSGVTYKPDNRNGEGLNGALRNKLGGVGVMFHNATQSENPSEHAEETLERLHQAVRRITGRSMTRRERMLVKMITSFSELPATPSEKTPQDARTPPLEIVRALRSPVGTQQLVSTRVSGHRARVVINPLGKPDPDREAAVWKCIVDLAEAWAV
ncbi:hypothetical protein [Streptosporangium sp. G12]